MNMNDAKQYTFGSFHIFRLVSEEDCKYMLICPRDYESGFFKRNLAYQLSCIAHT